MSICSLINTEAYRQRQKQYLHDKARSLAAGVARARDFVLNNGKEGATFVDMGLPSLGRAGKNGAMDERFHFILYPFQATLRSRLNAAEGTVAALN